MPMMMNDSGIETTAAIVAVIWKFSAVAVCSRMNGPRSFSTT